MSLRMTSSLQSPSIILSSLCDTDVNPRSSPGAALSIQIPLKHSYRSLTLRLNHTEGNCGNKNKNMDILQIVLLLDPLVAVFVIGITTFLLLMWYSGRKHEYWKRRGVPHVKPFPFLGTILQNMWKPLHEVELQRYLDLGRIYGHFEGNEPLLSVGDSKVLRQILVKDFHIFPNGRSYSTGDEIMDSNVTILTGEDWKRVRTIMTPTFTTGKIKKMLNIFKECSRSIVEIFAEGAKNGKPVDSKNIFSCFSMDVIAHSAFSTKLNSHKDPENEFVQTARKFFSQDFNWKFFFFMLCPNLMKFFNVSGFDSKGLDFYKRLVAQIIEERKRSGETRNDFLQLLLNTAKESNVEESEDEKENADITSNYEEETIRFEGLKNMTNKKLSTNELIAQCLVFFLAGFDTISSTLSFASYLLALNPDVQDKLRTEVDEALKETDGELTYEAIQSMKYLDNVISETLRMYPPALRIERMAVADCELSHTGIKIPKGMIITIPIYAMHRDPKYFPEPEKFNPNRFTAEGRAQRDQYCYLPFGAGPRSCIGMRFALVEIKVCLAYIIANFIIKKHPRTAVPLTFYTGQIILQPKEVLLEYEPRKEASPIK